MEGDDAAAIPRRRGRPALRRATPLVREEIVDAALLMVQRNGVDALSMRRLADELGVTTMALYHYVPDKPSLMAALVDRVWEQVFVEQFDPEPDPIEAAVQRCLAIRRVWLSYFDLASLAVAVAVPDDAFFDVTARLTASMEGIGFSDVPLAYNALQNFTMGSVQIAAARRASSLYFGRDPKVVLTRARRLLSRRGATDNHRGVVEGRFDEGDERYFEASLRALVVGLLAGD